MKKWKQIFLLLLCLCIVCFATYYVKKEKTKPVKQSKEILLEEKDKLELPNISQILFMEQDKIFYEQEKDVTDFSATPVFYQYNISDRTSSKPIGALEDFTMSTVDICIKDDFIYYPYIALKNGKESNLIAKIEKNGKSQSVIQEKKNKKFISLWNDRNHLYEYYQIDVPNTKNSKNRTDCYFDYIDTLEKKDKKHILHTKLDDNGGSLLVDISLDKEKLYAYVIHYEKEKEKHFIEVYSKAGAYIEKYEIDVKNFLKLKEVGDTDSINHMYQVNDYFILETINHRIQIYKLQDKKLEKAYTPDDLTMFDNGGFVLENYEEKSPFVYIEDAKHRENLYIFDSETGKFSFIKFKNKSGQVDGMYRDLAGNIVLEVVKEEKQSYYYIDASKIIKS